jgi:dienelactone hydrolase
MFTAPMQLDVLAAVDYLRNKGAKTVAVMGGSFGGTAAADASIASKPGEISRLILLAAEGNGPAERIKAPLLQVIDGGGRALSDTQGAARFFRGNQSFDRRSH